MTPLLISRYTATSALGAGLAAHARALRETHSGLRQQAFEDSALACWTGTVDGLDVALSKRWAEWDCRIHRLAALALEQDGFRGAVADAVARHGADRVAVFIGTSPAGPPATEHAPRQRAAHGRPPATSFRPAPPQPNARPR